MEAVARELVRRDVVPKLAGLCALGQKVADHGAELQLRSGDLPVSMQERREFGVVVPVRLVGDEGEGLQHGFESLAGVPSLVSDFGELVEMAGFVPPPWVEILVLGLECPGQSPTCTERRIP